MILFQITYTTWRNKMELEDLEKIIDKIMIEGLEISESSFLNELYKISEIELEEEKFETIIKDFRKKDKMKYTFAFYIGFLNRDIENINDLPNITKLKSYSNLKGYLMQYFKGHLNINYKYFPVTPYHNYYSFIKEWWPIPFSIPQPLILLLNWIYKYDKKYFFKLMFNEKHNYLFISLLKGKIINNLKINNDIDFNFDDDLKMYALFNYLIEPFTNENSRFKSDVEMWHHNFNILKRIELPLLIRIILDYIKSPKSKKILIDVANILKDNYDIFYSIFNDLEIKNLRELSQLFNVLHELEIIPKDELLRITLNKLKNKFSNKFITIDMNDWKIFLSLLNSSEINKVEKLINDSKNNLKYISELDKEVRYEKYLIDIKKSEKFDELLAECNLHS